jgi:hypothetical protein
MFGFVKTMLPGHVASSSWGRGVSKADGTLILPGDPMATGCTVLFPTDMSKHYDLSRRTVINESWKANSIRYRYRPSQTLIPTLLDTVKSLQEKTSWYREVNDDYPSIPMPTSYKDLSEWKIAIQALVSDDDVEEVDDEEEVDGEEFDEEVNVYLTRQHALQSILEPSADMLQKDEAEDEDSDEGEFGDDSGVTGGAFTGGAFTGGQGESSFGGGGDRGKGAKTDQWKAPTSPDGIRKWFNTDEAFVDSLQLPADQKEQTRRTMVRYQDAILAARDGGGVDHDHVRELRIRYDEVVHNLVTHFDHMLGDAKVNDARKALETAVMANDSEAFDEARADLNAAIKRIG